MILEILEFIKVLRRYSAKTEDQVNTKRINLNVVLTLWSGIKLAQSTRNHVGTAI